jgi:hypothetical protein
MIKGYGKIECVKIDGKLHVIGEEINTLCGERIYFVRNYYGRKDYMLRRNEEAITCEKCKELYKNNIN